MVYSGDSHLPIEIRREIDRLADQFERELKADSQPKIEAFLDRISDGREHLLGELIRIEIELRRVRGEQPQMQEYDDRFPNYHTVVLAAFCPEKATEVLPTLGDESDDVPDIIGPYKILQLIGKGGMGRVYLGEQTEPVRRRVALKVIKSESPTKEIIARFEAERQALTLMDHQNIAKVVDAGITADGGAYFAMELVKGIPITAYCDQNKLGLDQRLRLFVQTCRAIQHAHQKGIIHRDIKPSNVLVTLYDGKPTAKVIDFGLAKALDAGTQLTNRTLFTQFGQIVGTLEYMSPEQAALNAMDIDTRSDVYSLGIIFYELLTGSTPIGRERLRSEAFDRVLQLIREEEAPRPSARLSDSGDAITGISDQRKTDPKRLGVALKGDLDWIAVRTLEKDRTRRYNGAGELADDVERFLNNEPIEARPPSMSYRLHRAVRRHRVAFGVAALIGVLLLSSAIVMGLLAYTARNATIAALDALAERDSLIEEKVNILEKISQLNFELEGVNTELENEIGATFRILKEVLDKYEAFSQDLISQPLLKSPQLKSARNHLLNRAKNDFSAIINVLEREQRDDSENLQRLADTYASLGKVESELGEFDTAFESYSRTLSIREECNERFGGNAGLATKIANAKTNLVLINHKRGKSDEAITLCREALKQMEALESEHPADPEVAEQAFLCRLILGTILMETGNMTESEQLLAQATQYANARLRGDVTGAPGMIRMLVGSLINLANHYSNTMRFDESLEMYAQVLDLAEQLVEKLPDAGFDELLAASYMNYGALNHRIFQAQGDSSDSERRKELISTILEYYGKAKQAFTELSSADPFNSEFHSKLASIGSSLGLIAFEIRDFDLARSEFTEALANMDSALADSPDRIEYLSAKAQLLGNQAAMFGQLGEIESARTTMEEAIELFKRLVEIDPGSIIHKVYLAGSYGNLGMLSQQLEDYESAKEWAQKSVDEAKRIDAVLPNNPSIVQYLSNGYENLAISHMQLGEHEAALAQIDNAVGVGVQGFQNKYKALRVGALADLKRTDEAVASLNSLIDSSPLDPQASYNLAFSISRLLAQIDGNGQDAKRFAVAAVEGLDIAKAAGLIESFTSIADSADLKPLTETDEFKKRVQDEKE